MIASDDNLTSLVLMLYIFLGLCMGSFASAISYRIQNNLSWITQKDSTTGHMKPVRSMCPKCTHQLSLIDLIPLLSWLFSFGKCRYCYSKISIRYPLIELAAALVVLSYHFFGFSYFEIAIGIILLPFSLSFMLLIQNRFNPPGYIYFAIISNVAFIVYSLLSGKMGITFF
jgi:leader peptidase (prepilin peptidase)/N-methyltransferase